MQTIGKLFFMLVIVGCAAAMLGAVLGSFGLLPDSAYLTYYQFKDTYVSGLVQHVSPSLNKFEGHWNVEMKPDVADSPTATCSSFSGYVVSHNGAVHGTLHGKTAISGASLSITIDQLGKATGDITNTIQKIGSLTATFGDGRGVGTWSSDTECLGTITFVKVTPSVDPIAGHLVSTQGSVTLTRDGESASMYPTMALYEGDVLTVGTGGAAHLGIGYTNTSTDVGSGQTYTVPSPLGQ